MSSKENLKILLAKGTIRIESATAVHGGHLQSTIISQNCLVEILSPTEGDIPPTDSLKISALYRLPICFDHSAIAHCMERYIVPKISSAIFARQYCTYLMKANCIDLLEQFKNQCCWPNARDCDSCLFLVCQHFVRNLDPRTRFKTGKFNPARTFTPKGALGSGQLVTQFIQLAPPVDILSGVGLPRHVGHFGRLKVSHGRPWFQQF